MTVPRPRLPDRVLASSILSDRVFRANTLISRGGYSRRVVFSRPVPGFLPPLVLAVGLLGSGVLTACSSTSDGGSGERVVPESTVSAQVSATSSPASALAQSSLPDQGRITPTRDAAHPPPYISTVDWVNTSVGPSLQIYPTPNGRLSSSDDGAAVAWAEVLALAPTADTPGMRAQFDCHWTFARLVEPNKPSWNIEPDRPVVTEQQMVAARCNPGAPEE